MSHTEKHKPDSSTIEHSSYDPETKTMQVKFKTGGTYQYHGVTPEIYQTYLDAPSKGKYLHSIIKVGCPCEKISA